MAIMPAHRLVGCAMSDQVREGWTEVFHGSQVQAETFAAILQADGMEPQVLTDSFAGWGGMPVVGAETAGLFVPEHEAQRAVALLAQAQGR
jgi:hypothetical protein